VVVGFNSIGKKIQVPVLLLIVAILSAMGIIMATKSQHTQKDLLISKSQSMAHLMAKISAPSIANFEFSALDGFIQEVTKGDSDVAFAVFYNDKGKPITKADPNAHKDASLLHYEEKIIHPDSGQAIGTFRIGYRQTALTESFRNNVLITVASVVIATILLFFGVAMVVRRLVTGPLRELEVVIEAVSHGQLNQKVSIQSNDEIGHIAEVFNAMVGNLRELVAKIHQATENIASSATRLMENSTQISSGSRQQMDAAISTSSALEEIVASIDHVAESVRETVTISNQAATGSEGGQKIAKNAADEMAKIANTIMLSSEVIGSLGQRTSRISGIVGEIKAISDQTNLLALNAAIEAARAGEQGRGFAVVADEVRKLAERVGNATTEITAMIDAILGESDQAISNIEAGKAQVQQGVALANGVADTLSQINAGAKSTLARIHEIAEATAEQSRTTHEINKNVSSIAEMAERNNAEVDKASRTSEQLQMHAKVLDAAIKQFKL
jgi:methyl-accepting chemotaxis protein